MGGLPVLRKSKRMNKGKLPETVMKRSIFRQLPKTNKQVLIGAGVGADAAAVSLTPGCAATLCTDAVIWTQDQDAGRVVHSVCNDLACIGAEPTGLLLTAMLPSDTEEAAIRRMLKDILAICTPMGIAVLGGHTEITSAVSRPVISVTGVGEAPPQRLLSPGQARAGDDLLVTKWVGLEGSFRIVHAGREELLSRYPAYFLDEAAGYDRLLSVLPEARIALDYGASALHDISDGGVFGALWEMAETAGLGLEVELKKIPIRQETVEICNFFDLNPYQLVSGGSLLIAAKDGDALVDRLAQGGIYSAVIGRMTEGRDRLVCNEEERRFLEPPRRDEIHRLLG